MCAHCGQQQAQVPGQRPSTAVTILMGDLYAHGTVAPQRPSTAVTMLMGDAVTYTWPRRGIVSRLTYQPYLIYSRT